LQEFGGGVFTFGLRCGFWWCKEIGDRFAEEAFEEPRGCWPEGIGWLAGDESLEVAQTERAWFATVPGEGLDVLDEFFEGHASLPDARFEQCPWRPVGQTNHLPRHGVPVSC
jgi:hypothetical protein